MWTILKILIECVTIWFLFYILCSFGWKTCEILYPRPGFEPTCPALETEVLPTGPPGKSRVCLRFHTWDHVAFVFLCRLISLSIMSSRSTCVVENNMISFFFMTALYSSLCVCVCVCVCGFLLVFFVVVRLIFFVVVMFTFLDSWLSLWWNN